MIMAAPIICTQCGCQLQNDGTCKNCEYLKANKMKQKKTFSVDDGTLKIIDNHVVLFVEDNAIASTDSEATDILNIHLLPQSILYPTDEELAEESLKDKKGRCIHDSDYRDGFLDGRKSFGDKEFHLTRGELKKLLTAAAVWVASFDDIISTIIHPTFPHTITVQKEGDVYDWKNLKAEYE